MALTPNQIDGQVNAAGYFLARAVSPAGPVSAGLLFSSLGGTDALLAMTAAMALTAPVHGEQDYAAYPRLQAAGGRLMPSGPTANRAVGAVATRASPASIAPGCLSTVKRS